MPVQGERAAADVAFIAVKVGRIDESKLSVEELLVACLKFCDELIDLLTGTLREPFTAGQNSKERSIQNDREKSVLQEIYFTREMTPDTPKEADPDSNSVKPGQPALIPAEDAEADENGVLHYGHKPWPTPKENEVSQQAQIASQFSLPPALSSLLSTYNKTGIESHAAGSIRK